MGLGATWFSAVSSVDYGDFGGKFAFGLVPFAYAPLLIPFLPYLGAARRNTRGAIWQVAAYSVVLVAAALVRNSRGTFGEAFVTLVLLLLLLYVSGNLRLSRRALGAAVLFAMPAVVALGFLTDLSTAILMVRAQRTEVTGASLLELTLEQLGDTEAIQNYTQLSLAPTPNGYSEYYISNPLLARLITVKFDDNLLQLVPLLTPNQREDISKTSLKQIAALLPTPAIRILGLDVDKRRLAFSMGAYMYDRGSGRLSARTPWVQ